MKHLKRIFENNNDDLIEYINMCFVDLLDSGIEVKTSTDYYQFTIDLHQVEDTIESISELATKMIETTDMISDSMRKVKLEYPDIKYNVYFSRITGKRNYVINLIIHLDDDTKWDW